MYNRKNTTMKKIGKTELNRLKKFEDKILNLTDEDAPKYSIDYEMESQIRYDVLIDNFGVAAVTEALKTLDIRKEDLFDQPIYLDIYNHLSTK
jgi:hypothetical protein